MKTNVYFTLGIIQSLFMAPLKVILLYSQNGFRKQTNVAEPATSRPKISQKNNLCPTHSLKKKNGKGFRPSPANKID